MASCNALRISLNSSNRIGTPSENRGMENANPTFVQVQAARACSFPSTSLHEKDPSVTVFGDARGHRKSQALSGSSAQDEEKQEMQPEHGQGG